METELELSKQKRILFEEVYEKIKAEAFKYFGHRNDFEDLFQVLLLNYVIALSKADISKNYHSYCMRNGIWMCFQETKKTSNYWKRHIFVGDIRYDLDYHNDKNVDQTLNRIDSDSDYNSALDGIVDIINDLPTVERKVIRHDLFGDRKCTPTVKKRRQQMIKKSFKGHVKEFLSAA